MTKTERQEYYFKLGQLMIPLLQDLNEAIKFLGPNVPASLVRGRLEIENAIDDLFLTSDNDLEVYPDADVNPSKEYSEQYMANMAGLTLEEYKNGK